MRAEPAVELNSPRTAAKGGAAPQAFQPLQAIIGLGAIQAGTMLAGLLRTKVLALLLGPDGLGIVGVIDQTVAFFTHLGTLSLPLAALKFLSKRKSAGMEAFARLYRAFLMSLLVASVLSTALGVALAFARTGVLSDELSPHRTALILGLLTAAPLAVVALLRNVLATLERYRAAALVALFGAVLLVGSSYAGVRLVGLPGLYVGNLVVHTMLAVLLMGLIRRVPGMGTPSPGPGTVGILRSERGLISFCTSIHFLSLASPLAYLVARVTILSHHGAEAAGLFYAAYGLAVAIRVVLNQANGLYLSPIVNESTPKNVRAAKAGEYMRVLMVILVLGAAAVALFPQLFLIALYSKRFLPAGAFLGAFLVSEAILLVAGVYQALLIGFDDIRSHVAISLAGNAIIAGVSLALVPSQGPLGAALAFIAGHTLILLLTAGRLQHAHGARGAMKPFSLLLLGLLVLALGALWTTRVDPPFVWRALAYVGVAVGALSLLNAHERRWILAPWRSTRNQ